MYSSILVGADGSETATEAVAQATALACELSARLLIVSAYEPASAGRRGSRPDTARPDSQWALSPREDVMALLEHAAASALAAGVRSVDTFARQGDAADAIIDVAEEEVCDLIVVGNRGMTGARRFLLGSVPNRVSHHAPCSVLIVRTS
jgi:nucleotide-binding universal stress UspA family protein